jgi:spermine oxidase
MLGVLLESLKKKIPDPKKALPIEEKIWFNKVVSNIQWSRCPETTVRVTCSDGSVIDADHVIVTTSLGVLKEK